MIILKKPNYNLKMVTVTIFFIFLAASFALAEESVSPEQLFYAGNDYYEKGEYTEAIGEYEKIVASGYESANVYYNLGNAYFRAGETGKAILDYERAKRLMPRDADCDANYAFVRARARGPVLTRRGMWGWGPLRRYYESFTVDGLLLISSGLYILAIIVLFAAVYRHYMARRFVVIAFAVFLLLACNLFVTWHKINEIGKEAIILVTDTDSHYGPSDSATVFFRLYEGMKVIVRKEKDDWCEVVRLDGKRGWIHKEDLEII